MILCHIFDPGVVVEAELSELELLAQVLDIYDQSQVARCLNQSDSGGLTRETINRWVRGKSSPTITASQYRTLQNLLPQPPRSSPDYDFRFIDLFAGIGGLRRPPRHDLALPDGRHPNLDT